MGPPYSGRQGGASEHDHGYKRLFSDPKVVEELIRGFLREDWTAKLDFSTLERVPSSFVSDDLRERHSDVIWRLRFKGENRDWFYLYLLLEFQSTSYHFMAVRLLSYVSLLLEQIIRSEKLGASDRLPAVLPLVIYNGKRPWRAPRDLRSLFVPLPDLLRRRLPQLTYQVLDQGRLDLELPELAGNRTAAAFRIETAEDLVHLPRLTRGLFRLLPPEEDPALRQTFEIWYRALLRRNFPSVSDLEIMDLEEASMLEETVREWEKKVQKKARQEGRQEGRREGRKKGRREGVIEGMQRVLLRLMSLRFGDLPQDVRRQVAQLTSVQELEDMTRRVLGAKSLREVGLDS